MNKIIIKFNFLPSLCRRKSGECAENQYNHSSYSHFTETAVRDFPETIYIVTKNDIAITADCLAIYPIIRAGVSRAVAYEPLIITPL